MTHCVLINLSTNWTGAVGIGWPDGQSCSAAVLGPGFRVECDSFNVGGTNYQGGVGCEILGVYDGTWHVGQNWSPSVSFVQGLQFGALIASVLVVVFALRSGLSRGRRGIEA